MGEDEDEDASSSDFSIVEGFPSASRSSRKGKEVIRGGGSSGGASAEEDTKGGKYGAKRARPKSDISSDSESSAFSTLDSDREGIDLDVGGLTSARGLSRGGAGSSSVGVEREEERKPQRGRTELMPIRKDSAKVKKLRDDRKKMEEEIARRARHQSKAAKRRGDLEKVVINLGHDDTEQPIYVDEFLAEHLKPHQITGVQFLWKSIVMIKAEAEDGSTHHQGCVLAHSMGLGKTLQTITFLYTLQREARANNPCIPEHLKKGGILVVCPAIVVENWAFEINKWIPPQQRDEVLGGIFTFSLVPESERIEQLESWQERRGVFIISYNLLRTILVATTEMEGVEPALPRPPPSTPPGGVSEEGTMVRKEEAAGFREYLIAPGPSFVVCDESHVIKNPQASISMFLNSVQTPSRLCLTGYPLQNNLEEYHAMVDFVSPGFLGPLRDFRNQYHNPIMNGFFADSTPGDKVISQQRLFVLVHIIAPLICRMSNSILQDDLPEKHEYVISVKLTAIQHRLYLRYLECIQGADVNRGIIVKFNKLLTLSNHPGCFKASVEAKTFEEKGYESEQAAENRTLREMLRQEPITDWMDPTMSVKLMIAEEIVRMSAAVNDKVLIFSRSVPTIELIKHRLQSSFKLQLILGKTKDRQRLIDAFNDPANGFNAFVISTIAGGIGINISSANRVIIFDHGWNPSQEHQAVARAYRYGQTKKVYVYHLLTNGAFEERVFMNNVHKITLATQVVDQKLMEKTAFKNDMRRYYTPPPLNPECEVPPDATFPDDVMQRVWESHRNDIVRIESHSHFVREMEDELTQTQHDVAMEALVAERLRRKNGQPFVETLRDSYEEGMNAVEDGGTAAAAGGGVTKRRISRFDRVGMQGAGGGGGGSGSSLAEAVEQTGDASEEEIRLLEAVAAAQQAALVAERARIQAQEDDELMLSLQAEGWDFDDEYDY
ncbi:hypothetical protein HDU98_009215 [Podochytrium sp. JEL0797]|nr:hypothetical protein HDU98_009215 [Podochytrium sp. JEL0797]